MNMPIAHKKMLLAYAPFALVVASLSACAPAYVPEPVYSAPMPQAMPLEPRPLPAPPAIQVQAPPVQQPRRFDPPPTVTPIEARPKIVAEPLPESRPKKSSVPSVTYIPEKSVSPSRQIQASPVNKPAELPFWDQSKVQVEVLDLPTEKTTPPNTSSSNTLVPSQTGTSTTQLSANQTESATSTAQAASSSSPVVAVLLKQANNELSVGKPDRAATTLERALRIAPNDANLWIRLAEVNEQMGNKSQAASMARKALDLAPDDTAVRLRAQRLAN